MSKIISPVPVEIKITFSEMNGACSFSSSKDIPFPVIVGIFAQLTLQFLKNAGAAFQAQQGLVKKGNGAIDG